jgi:hypothetical protein
LRVNLFQNATPGLAVIFLLHYSAAVHANRVDLEILGWVESAMLVDPVIPLKAKLDTGAETSSLDAGIIKKFRKNGKRWVRFRINDRETGKEHIVVRERVRTVGIIQHDGSTQSRPVVMMKVCIAGQILKTEVSLIDRSEFNYPLLLGRNVLESFALVDSGSTFLSDPDCAPAVVDTGKEP